MYDETNIRETLYRVLANIIKELGYHAKILDFNPGAVAWYGAPKYIVIETPPPDGWEPKESDPTIASDRYVATIIVDGAQSLVVEALSFPANQKNYRIDLLDPELDLRKSINHAIRAIIDGTTSPDSRVPCL